MIQSRDSFNAFSVSGDKWLERIKAKTQEDRFPLHCQWEITCRCNLKCVMCYTDCFNTPEHVRRELSTRDILRIMDEMKTAGVLELTLTGGEPMARPDFKTLYLHAVQSGFMTTVFTNGTYINSEWIELWKKFPPHRIEISVHGAQASTFDQVTAKAGSYDRVTRAVQLVAEAGLPLMIKTTGLTLNGSEVFLIKQWARAFPCVLFRLNTSLRPQADGGESPFRYELSELEAEVLYQSDPEFHEAYQSAVKKEEACPAVCHEGKKQFHIDAYGTLQLCSRNRRDGYDLKKGSFAEGFYQAVPHFRCPRKKSSGSCCPAPASHEAAHA